MPNYPKSYDVLGYTADADCWCPACARDAYPGCETGDVEGHEGNMVHPIFRDSEWDTPPYCGGCLKPIEGARVLMVEYTPGAWEYPEE